MSIDRPLSILHLEDDPDYTALVEGWLRRDGIVADVEPVANRADFELALKRGGHDLLLVDFQLPGYNGMEALRFARSFSSELPIILLSGRIGENAAVESLHVGATDFVLKSAPDRLMPSIRRALGEQELRRKRQAAETQLIKQQKFFQALTDHSLDIVAVLDQDTRFLYLSPSVTRTLGYSPSELEGRPAIELVHPGDSDVVRAVAQASLENGGDPIRFEIRMRHQEGGWRELEIISQDRFSDPDLGVMVINARDITDRRHVEEDLRDSERRFREFFESSPDAIFVEDFSGVVLDVNPAACELHAMSRGELVGKRLQDLVPAEMRAEVLERFAKMTDGTVHQAEGFSVRRDGTHVPVEIRVKRIEYQGRAAVLLHVRDVSEHKRLEEQLRHSQKLEALGQLAGGVAHDFNNLLTVISGHAAMLRTSCGSAPEVQRSADQVLRAADRAAALTRQLLAFGRRQPMQPQMLDLNEVVRSVTTMLARILGEDIALHIQYSSEPVVIHGDSGMLEQILMNLAVNARDAMPKGGALGVGIARRDLSPDLGRPGGSSGSFVCLTVADSGCGIPSEHLDRIFDPFFTTKEVGKGTGLGLSMVYGIVRQHGGWIEVESHPGQGATFRVFLPRSTAAATARHHTPAEPEIRGGEETILVVEDEREVRELVCQLLSAQGYRILQAETGAVALELWKNCKDKVDLLLTDLVMPDDVNGQQLAERLRRERPELKVLITSGYTAEVEDCDSSGDSNTRFLQKPYHPSHLANAVRQCLDTTAAA